VLFPEPVNPNTLPPVLGHFEADVPQHRSFRVIAERNIFEAYITVYPLRTSAPGLDSTSNGVSRTSNTRLAAVKLCWTEFAIVEMFAT
jgi:hypothetical protein